MVSRLYVTFKLLSQHHVKLNFGSRPTSLAYCATILIIAHIFQSARFIWSGLNVVTINYIYWIVKQQNIIVERSISIRKMSAQYRDIVSGTHPFGTIA